MKQFDFDTVKILHFLVRKEFITRAEALEGMHQLDISDKDHRGYSKYYFKNSIEWQFNRNLQLEVDGNKCQECGTNLSLEIHHVYSGDGSEINESYENIPFERIGIDLQTLCKFHHLQKTNTRRGIKYAKTLGHITPNIIENVTTQLNNGREYAVVGLEVISEITVQLNEKKKQEIIEPSKLKDKELTLYERKKYNGI